jgi:oxygen-independent coproporphyrinogen-3 oxidase
MAKCSYCDFFSLPAASFSDSFLEDLIDAIQARAELLAERFESPGFSTVYIGGGTPTVLSERLFDRLLASISPLAPSPLEWTVEANPESLGMYHLESMLRHGVTRISIGVQSMNDEELQILGRLHDSAQAVRAVHTASEAGLVVSVDLIAGIPSMGYCSKPVSGLSDTALALIEAGVSHLSVYDLVLEEGTPLARNEYSLCFPGEDRIYDERSVLDEQLSQRGIRRYEVSNYSSPGMECLHNLVYWKIGSYIGSGPGAVSTIVARESDSPHFGVDGSSLRIEEHKNIGKYIEDRGECSVETMISPRESAFEELMMAFRTVFGLDCELFQKRFGARAENLIENTLSSWSNYIVPGEALYEGCNSRSMALNYQGLDLLNRFLADCLEELDEKYPAHSETDE